MSRAGFEADELPMDIRFEREPLELRLLPDTKAPEDLTEEIVRRDLSGDAAEMVLREPELFGKQFQGAI